MIYTLITLSLIFFVYVSVLRYAICADKAEIENQEIEEIQRKATAAWYRKQR